jgi:hypothetical protein
LISDREQIEWYKQRIQQLAEKGFPRRILSCQLNRTIPNLSDEENFEKWQNLEIAKHRLQKNRFDLPSKMSNDKEDYVLTLLYKE